jgi:hypothetical protein
LTLKGFSNQGRGTGGIPAPVSVLFAWLLGRSAGEGSVAGLASPASRR